MTGSTDSGITIGIIGGSGFDQWPFEGAHTALHTGDGYGATPVYRGETGGNYASVGYIARHGHGHSLAPHNVPYQENIRALKNVGAKVVVATCITGSLRPEIAPGTLVLPDQFVDFTRRAAGVPGMPQHVPMADPYCQALRKILVAAGARAGIPITEGGTVVVVEGPRFNTRAESVWYQSQGWHLVNMTQFPEAYFARAAGICYAAVAGVTDFDVCVDGDNRFDALRIDRILETFRHVVAQQKALLTAALSDLSEHKCDSCSRWMMAYYHSPIGNSSDARS